MAPHTSNVLKKLFETFLNKSTYDAKAEYYRCIEGKVKVASAICKLPFDMICFTGSTSTGRLVAIEAAKNLTPCLLELGGKCPAIVDESASIDNAVMRILFGKLVNSGQTCVGVDHIFLHKEIADKFKVRLLEKLKEGYGDSKLKNSGDYAKIITEGHVDRLKSYLEENHEGKVLHEGQIIRS